MTRGVRWYLVSSIIVVTLIVLAGCSHYMLAERELWRHDAEIACLNSGAVKESPTRVRIAAISGPGACGIDYPLKVSALGEAGPLGYTDEPPTPPGAIPDGTMPQHWPINPSSTIQSQPSTIQSNALPPLQAGASPPPPLPQPGAPPYNPPPYPQAQYGQPQYVQPQYAQPQYAQPQYAQPQYGGPQPGPPMSLTPPGISVRPSDEAVDQPPIFTPRPLPAPVGENAPPPYDAPPPLGPPAAPLVTAAAGPVEVKPAATLACPIVSALDQWISGAVQPAAQHWFRQPVVEIKQISAYSCRGMNGDPNAHISEHAFGNALDIAEFTLADGHRISVQYGWHGTPEEQGFLHDVQAAACDEFTTVLAPGANIYHYNHIHVDLMRHYGGKHICEPAAIPGDVVAERARAHYAAQHGEPSITGSISAKIHRALGYSDDDDHLPEAVPGDD
jgi:hypothetical protein